MKEPLLILLGLFILVGLAYEPLMKESQRRAANPTVRGDSSLGTSSATTANRDLGYTSAREMAEAIRQAERETQSLESRVGEVSRQMRRSPYYGKVRLSNISGLNQSDPSREYMNLYANLKKDESLKITGWYLQSEVTGYYAVIPGAALLPFPFVKDESEVVLLQGDRVVLTKGFSPIGISFRTNKCSGYFEENRTFYPGLSLQCPLPRDEELPTFSSVYDRNDECVRLIERIPRCQTVTNQYLRDLPDTVPAACKDYMTANINYNSCVAGHFGDTDFPGKEYRIYLNKFGPLWRPRHDTINLHDKEGLIVSTISY